MSKFHLTKCRCCKLGYICDILRTNFSSYIYIYIYIYI